MKSVFALVYGDCAGSTDIAYIMGVFSTKERADEARALQYGLGYHGRIGPNSEMLTVEEIEMDKIYTEAIRVV